ncbi:spore coat protein [Aneurinibacillus sp. Ricciae_BoGa-3]|uniref:spore coat protein n=1 Tax=Aneurinibacillus sp. Ricciae_BoGa-3 TaxID=3022697 RepID=UPI0023426360|nr:spore coat protein [Aneurinibacillus sp. Ricciae_BoGa-3]WCK56507.1 spore coat protein [Aneurinibacillus sp. Ricciae_BoGa-3]
MNNDFLDPINANGMPNLADSLFALDFLMAAKNGVRNCAYALTEMASPEARALARKQLEQALALHDDISKLMMDRGWLHPYNVNEQFQLDIKSAETTVKIAGMKIFPDHTSRLGSFADLNN